MTFHTNLSKNVYTDEVFFSLYPLQGTGFFLSPPSGGLRGSVIQRLVVSDLFVYFLVLLTQDIGMLFHSARSGRPLVKMTN